MCNVVESLLSVKHTTCTDLCMSMFACVCVNGEVYMRCYIYNILLIHFAQLYDAIWTCACACVRLCIHLFMLMCVTAYVYEKHVLV